MLDWIDDHSAAVSAASTLVLVIITGYYAWVTRSLLRETHVSLQAAARSTLQQRLDRISEICIRHPDLFASLSDENSTGEEQDGRLHLANMFLGVLEEAYLQYEVERSMSAEDWSAWVATADMFLERPF